MSVSETGSLSVPRPSRPVTFKRHLVPHVIDGEAVYLVSERGVSVVDGRLAGMLAPLLDGTRSVDDIAAALEGLVEASRVTAAVDKLVDRGWATFADPDVDRSAAAFFDLAGPDGDRSVSAVATGIVRLEAYGDIDPEPVAAALRAAGIGRVDVAASGELAIAETNSADLVIA